MMRTININLKHKKMTKYYRFLALLLYLNSNISFGQDFFEVPSTSGLIEIKLYPMENVATGTPTLVTFGIPFTRGSLLPSELSKIRLLPTPASNTEITVYVSQVTPWRHLTNTVVDNQSVRIVKIQMQHTFSVSYPNFETVYVQYGISNRTNTITNFVNPKTAWHIANTENFLQADNIMEPDVYAVLPKQYLCNGALKLSRMKPLSNTIPATRENPSTVESLVDVNYSKYDHAQHNFFYSIINEDSPLVSNVNKCNYKTDSEPWLYDRVAAIYNLYMRNGSIKVLREAVRNAQFYKNKLYNATTTPASAIGAFSLKNPDPTAYIGNNGAMYSYNEGLMYTYWLTGDDDMYNPIQWVVNAYEANNPPTRWATNAGSWTERFTSFRLHANIIAYEVTGNASYKNALLSQSEDLIWHQNGADGAIPANRVDGGLYHYGAQHGDGTANELVASSWMSNLFVAPMVRLFAIGENVSTANFVRRLGVFEIAALKLDANHSYTSDNPNALWYSDYMVKLNGASDERSSSDIEHSMDIASLLSWSAYFSIITNGTVDNTFVAAANNAYKSYLVGVNYWIRPTANSSGFTAYRVAPWRKYNWEYYSSASFSQIMTTIPNSYLPINDFELENSFAIAPNPILDKLQIINKERKAISISIFNVLGNKIFESPESINDNIDIDLSNLSSGIYIANIITNSGGLESFKILKK
jgi:Secretion system C-terminal sorting domain